MACSRILYIIHLLISRFALPLIIIFFFFSSRRRHTRFDCDWSSDVCSSDLPLQSREARRSPAFILRSYAVLATLSSSYPPRLGTFRCITHPFATRQRPKTCYRSTCMCKACRQRSI